MPRMERNTPAFLIAFVVAAAAFAAPQGGNPHGGGAPGAKPQDAKPQGGRPAGAGGGDERRAPPPPVKDWKHADESFLTNVKQVTFQGEKSGEAYYSPDQTYISYQSVRGDCPHYQIFVEKLDHTALWRVSPGVGLTTCSHWNADGSRLMWASTHLDPDTYGPPPAEGGAYAWNKHPSFEIFDSKPDGSDRRRLTDAKGYDAEGSYSTDGKRIVFTSERDGDLELYTMNADGSDVRRVTNAKGYDGGPFFSPDGARICFRAFRDEKNPRYANIYVINTDGTGEKQLTFDLAVNWAPFWHADNDTLVYSKNVGGHRNYELFLVKASGGRSIRLTRDGLADVLPAFSRDGKKLMWTSTRADGRSQIFTADFRMPNAEEWKTLEAEEDARLAAEKKAAEERAKGEGHGSGMAAAPTFDAKKLLADASFLADDKLEGRRAGTAKAMEAGQWVAEQFKAAGLKPAGDEGTYFQKFPMLVGLEASDESFAGFHVVGTDGQKSELLVRCAPTGFSGSKTGDPGRVEAPIVFRGYGVAIPGVSDDYAGLSDVKGKIVALFLRGVPESVLEQKDNPHADPQAWYGAYAKALNAKMKGAKAVVFIADSRQRNADGLEAPSFDGTGARLGIPCAQVLRSDFEKLLAPIGKKLADLERASTAEQGAGFDFEGGIAFVDAKIVEIRGEAANVVAIVPGTSKPEEKVLVTAHYDHLGFGGQGSLSDGGKPEIHNGADDNASGTAGLVAMARHFAANPTARTLVFIGFSGEEEGLLGSAHYVEKPLFPLAETAAVLNLDMIGRYRADEGVAIDGVASGEGLEAIVRAANTGGLKIATTGGAMSGRSDHASFIAAGVPGLHLFTGAHVDYHKPSDDADKLNAAGMADVTAYAAKLVRALADLPTKPVYVKPKAPEKTSSTGGFGAYLGTIPSYGSDSGGVKLSGVGAGSPAEKVGIKGGDTLVKLGDVDIDNIQDFTSALRMHKPGDALDVVVLRETERLTFKVILGRR